MSEIHATEKKNNPSTRNVHQSLLERNLHVNCGQFTYVQFVSAFTSRTLLYRGLRFRVSIKPLLQLHGPMSFCSSIELQRTRRAEVRKEFSVEDLCRPNGVFYGHLNTDSLIVKLKFDLTDEVGPIIERCQYLLILTFIL